MPAPPVPPPPPPPARGAASSRPPSRSSPRSPPGPRRFRSTTPTGAPTAWPNDEFSLVAVAYFACAVFALLVLGRLSNHHGRRPVSIVALLLAAAGCLTLLWVHSYLPLLIGRSLQGLAAGLASSAIGAYIVDTPPRRPRRRVLAVTTAPATVGLALGVFLSGPLVEFAPTPGRGRRVRLQHGTKFPRRVPRRTLHPRGRAAHRDDTGRRRRHRPHGRQLRRNPRRHRDGPRHLRQHEHPPAPSAPPGARRPVRRDLRDFVYGLRGPQPRRRTGQPGPQPPRHHRWLRRSRRPRLARHARGGPEPGWAGQVLSQTPPAHPPAAQIFSTLVPRAPVRDPSVRL
ncbi:hypothetical protein CFN17_11835 [Arthrobacter sp. PM3]|nr:hypothetical protein CFN17_11835 [Arthrobacter sp. PM3]